MLIDLRFLVFIWWRKVTNLQTRNLLQIMSGFLWPDWLKTESIIFRSSLKSFMLSTQNDFSKFWPRQRSTARTQRGSLSVTKAPETNVVFNLSSTFSLQMNYFLDACVFEQQPSQQYLLRDLFIVFTSHLSVTINHFKVKTDRKCISNQLVPEVSFWMPSGCFGCVALKLETVLQIVSFYRYVQPLVGQFCPAISVSLFSLYQCPSCKRPNIVTFSKGSYLHSLTT